MSGGLSIPERSKQVALLLQEQVQLHKTPCFQYAYFTQDTVLCNLQEGYSDMGKRFPVTETTTFHLFSITKTFTALAILQLAEVGNLDLANPVIQYLPSFPYGKNITIKHLLTHTAGLLNPIPLQWIHLIQEDVSFNRDQFFKLIFSKNRRVRAKPNERFAYSNLGYILLGQVIEAITRIPYEQYITKNILDILNLQPGELGFTIYDISQHAIGYQKRYQLLTALLPLFIDTKKYMANAEGDWKPYKPFYVNGTSYGGLIGRLQCLIKYGQALLQPDCPLISEFYKKLLFTENVTHNNKPSGMCLGWFKGNFKGQPYFTHAGGGGGYYSEIRLYPQTNTGSVILFNRTGMSDERFLSRVDTYFLSG